MRHSSAQYLACSNYFCMLVLIPIIIWKKASCLSYSFPLGSFDFVFSNSKSWEQFVHISSLSSSHGGGLAAVSDGRVSELLINDLCMILLRSQASGQRLR